MVAILMISAKMATLGLLKIKMFWYKDYDVIIYSHDVTNQILLRDSNCIIDVVMWPKFVTLASIWEKFSKPKCYKDLTRKTTFLTGGLGWSSILWDCQ